MSCVALHVLASFVKSTLGAGCFGLSRITPSPAEVTCRITRIVLVTLFYRIRLEKSFQERGHNIYYLFSFAWLIFVVFFMLNLFSSLYVIFLYSLCLIFIIFTKIIVLLSSSILMTSSFYPVSTLFFWIEHLL